MVDKFRACEKIDVGDRYDYELVKIIYWLEIRYELVERLMLVLDTLRACEQIGISGRYDTSLRKKSISGRKIYELVEKMMLVVDKITSLWKKSIGVR